MWGFGSSGGSSLEIDSVSKSFGPIRVVDDVSLSVHPGEFLALLGSSGSGKTTILSIIGGFHEADSGDVLIGGKSIRGLPSHRRDIGVVFQRYALFPHLSVAENLAYPLRRRGSSKAEIARDVGAALELVRMEGFGSRFPDQLSGGQQQRVALARALIFRPKLLLMDEPLGALDKNLRQQMQIELKLLHRNLGTTIVLVTHDQEEALSMADRVAIVEKGKLQQVDTPDEVYSRPSSAFVAGFVGETNMLPGVVTGVDDQRWQVRLGDPESDLSVQVPRENLAPGFSPSEGSSVQVGLRPENLTVRPGTRARVVETVFSGPYQMLLIQADKLRLSSRVAFSGQDSLFTADASVEIAMQGAHCRLYPSA
jgi:putative spermidine/putrescine transport system ATP-binding protein